MAKKIKTIIKVIAPGGAANPGPPIGPALGQHGVNIMEFVNQFNEATKEQRGQKIPAEITIYDDRTFTFVTKLPPASELIKQKLNLKAGASQIGRQFVGELTYQQLEEIAKEKMQDLNTTDVKAAMRTIAGQAKSMGVKTPEI